MLSVRKPLSLRQEKLHLLEPAQACRLIKILAVGIFPFAQRSEGGNRVALFETTG
jgi:hypothetical protein